MAQCALKLSKKFSPTMMSTTNRSSTTNMIVVPTRSRTNVRRFMSVCSWKCRVVLPVANELDEGLDLRVAEDPAGQGHRLVTGGIVRVVGRDRAPVRHHAAVVLEVGEPIIDAAVVVVFVEEPEPVLVVQRRPDVAFTHAAVALGTVLVVKLRAGGEGVLGVDDQVLVGVVDPIESKTKPAAVVADDAADGVDAFLRAGGCGGGIEERRQRAGQLGGLLLVVEVDVRVRMEAV